LDTLTNITQKNRAYGRLSSSSSRRSFKKLPICANCGEPITDGADQQREVDEGRYGPICWDRRECRDRCRKLTTNPLLLALFDFEDQAEDEYCSIDAKTDELYRRRFISIDELRTQLLEINNQANNMRMTFEELADLVRRYAT